MQLLIAHADVAARIALARVAAQADGGPLDLVDCESGEEVLERLLADDAPGMALVQWNLPGIDGLELCRLACQFHEGSPPYIILLAGANDDVAAGLDAGAADCVGTSASSSELRARIDAGRRLASQLARRAAAGGEDVRATLVAERSPFDEQDDEPVRGGFELASVIFAE